MKLIWGDLLHNMVKVMQTQVRYNQLILSINSSPLHLHTTTITPFIVVLIPFANQRSYGVQEHRMHSAILILYDRGTIKT